MSFLNPSKIIQELSIEEGMNIADFGSGSGGWVIPLAKQAKEGNIFALDVLSEALSALKGKAEMEKVYNIRTMLCDLEKRTDLRDNSIDLVVMSNLLFQLDHKESVIKEGHRVLRSSGKLLIVDWKNKETISENEANEMAINNGFNFIKKIDAGLSHFALLYEK